MAQNDMRSTHDPPDSMHMCMKLYAHVHSACMASVLSPPRDRGL